MKAQLRILSLLILAAATLVGVGCASSRTVGEQFDDGGITAKVKAKLAADPEVNPFNVDVDTLDGVVTLRGEVEKELARDEAEQHARNTKGVVEVRNEIRVVGAEDEDDERVSDAWITTKIKSKITADPQLNPFNIDVDTEDGRVTLSGKVEDESRRQEAEELARDTKGVVNVDNELQIESG